jgi:hypothetical protein
MRGNIPARAWWNFAMRRGSVFRPVLVAGLLAAVAGTATPSPAVAQAAPRDGEIAASVTPSPPPQGVPGSQVTCWGQRTNDGPSLHCTIRFDTPIDVLRPKVVDAANKSLEWTPVYHAFDPGEDETAFYILIDRRNARQAEMSDLSDVFVRAKGRQQIAVSVFANDLTRLQPFTTDRGAVAKAFDRISPGGSASELLHYATEAIKQLDTVAAPRKVLVIASSGRSEDPGYKLDDVVNLAQKTGVRIVTLGYVDRLVDTPAQQILERMSSLTGGFYYRSDQRKPLPPETRNAILTQFSAGGTLDATASRQLSSSAEVTLQHPNNLISSFAVRLADAQTSPEPKPSGTVVSELWDRLISTPWMLGAAAMLVLVITGAVIMLVRLSRARGKPEPASVDEVRNFLREREANGLARPGIPPDVPVAELVKKVEPPPPVEPPPRSEPAAKRVAAAEAPVIAWLEFNSAPGRVAVRKKHVTIGREVDNDVVTDPNEDTVSRHHAAISVNTNGRFQISNRSREYRHTPNPIFVNDQEMEHAELSEGDRVKLGTGSYGFVFVEVH